MKIIATAIAAVIATSSMSAPASAFFGPHFFWKPHFFFWKPHFPYKPYHPHKPPVKASNPTSHSGSSAGPYIVGCIFGGALGIIGAALAKGKAYNDPKIELTQNEVWPIILSCGLATGPVVAGFNQR
jgi:hypothetical protein